MGEIFALGWKVGGCIDPLGGVLEEWRDGKGKESGRALEETVILRTREILGYCLLRTSSPWAQARRVARDALERLETVQRIFAKSR